MQLSLLQHFFSTGLTFSVAFVNDAIFYQFSCSLPSLHWRFTEWIELSLIVHCTVSTHGMLCEIFKSARTRYTRTINIGRPSRSFKLLHIETNMPVKILNHCVPVITSVALTRVTGFYWKIRKKPVYIDSAPRPGSNEEGSEKLEKNLNNCTKINIIIITPQKHWTLSTLSSIQLWDSILNNATNITPGISHRCHITVDNNSAHIFYHEDFWIVDIHPPFE